MESKSVRLLVFWIVLLYALVGASFSVCADSEEADKILNPKNKSLSTEDKFLNSNKILYVVESFERLEIGTMDENKTIWFAPEGSKTDVLDTSNTSMSKALGKDGYILAPIRPGKYKLFVIDRSDPQPKIESESSLFILVKPVKSVLQNEAIDFKAGNCVELKIKTICDYYTPKAVVLDNIVVAGKKKPALEFKYTDNYEWIAKYYLTEEDIFEQKETLNVGIWLEDSQGNGVRETVLTELNIKNRGNTLPNPPYTPTQKNLKLKPSEGKTWKEYLYKNWIFILIVIIVICVIIWGLVMLKPFNKRTKGEKGVIPMDDPKIQISKKCLKEIGKLINVLSSELSEQEKISCIHDNAENLQKLLLSDYERLLNEAGEPLSDKDKQVLRYFTLALRSHILGRVFEETFNKIEQNYKIQKVLPFCKGYANNQIPFMEYKGDYLWTGINRELAEELKRTIHLPVPVLILKAFRKYLDGEILEERQTIDNVTKLLDAFEQYDKFRNLTDNREKADIRKDFESLIKHYENKENCFVKSDDPVFNYVNYSDEQKQTLAENYKQLIGMLRMGLPEAEIEYSPSLVKDPRDLQSRTLNEKIILHENPITKDIKELVGILKGVIEKYVQKPSSQKPVGNSEYIRNLNNFCNDTKDITELKNDANRPLDESIKGKIRNLFSNETKECIKNIATLGADKDTVNKCKTLYEHILKNLGDMFSAKYRKDHELCSIIGFYDEILNEFLSKNNMFEGKDTQEGKIYKFVKQGVNIYKSDNILEEQIERFLKENREVLPINLEKNNLNLNEFEKTAIDDLTKTCIAKAEEHDYSIVIPYKGQELENDWIVEKGFEPFEPFEGTLKLDNGKQYAAKTVKSGIKKGKTYIDASDAPIVKIFEPMIVNTIRVMAKNISKQQEEAVNTLLKVYEYVYFMDKTKDNSKYLNDSKNIWGELFLGKNNALANIGITDINIQRSLNSKKSIVEQLNNLLAEKDLKKIDEGYLESNSDIHSSFYLPQGEKGTRTPNKELDKKIDLASPIEDGIYYSLGNVKHVLQPAKVKLYEYIYDAAFEVGKLKKELKDNKETDTFIYKYSNYLLEFDRYFKPDENRFNVWLKNSLEKNIDFNIFSEYKEINAKFESKWTHKEKDIENLKDNLLEKLFKNYTWRYIEKGEVFAPDTMKEIDTKWADDPWDGYEQGRIEKTIYPLITQNEKVVVLAGVIVERYSHKKRVQTLTDKIIELGRDKARGYLLLERFLNNSEKIAELKEGKQSPITWAKENLNNVFYLFNNDYEWAWSAYSMEEMCSNISKINSFKTAFSLMWQKLVKEMEESGIVKIPIEPNKTRVTDAESEKGWKVGNSLNKKTPMISKHRVVYNVREVGIQYGEQVLRPPLVDVYEYDKNAIEED